MPPDYLWAYPGTLRDAPFAFRGRVEAARISGEAELGADKRMVPLVFTK